MGTIYNLEYDFSSQNGQSIIFSKKNEENLKPSDLNAVQLKMIQSNQIPHMLPLSLENIDLEAKLHYDINSKQKLITYFRDNKTTMNDYYQLFLSIINTLEESGSYMLDQSQYILAMEFLYIGQHAGDVYLTYLPIQGIEKTTSTTEDLKKLLTEVAGEIEGLQGNEFKSILSYIKKSSFSITGLKKLLLELISLRSNVYQQQFAPQNNAQQGINASTNMQGEQQNPNQASEQQRIVAGSENLKKTKTKKKLPALSSRERTYTILAVVLFSAFALKLGETSTILGLLLFVVAIAGGLTYWKIWRPGVVAMEVETETEVESEIPAGPQVQQYQPAQPNFLANQQVNQQAAPAFENNVAMNNVVEPVMEQEQFQEPVAPVFPVDAGSSALDTTLLNVDQDDTVLLEDEVAADLEPAASINVNPRLKRVTENEEPLTVEVDSENFLIGRNDEAVNYTDTAVGVSRMHVEIIRIDSNRYGIKDLGSKNGSKLNGNPMVPYKLYALNENDVFELGKAHYTFNWGNEE